MANNWSVCGICDSRQVSTPSDVWCAECDEGFCSNCNEHHSVSKATRSHVVIPIDEYQNLPADILAITQFCKKHDEKYQIYCKKHTSLCCRRCIIENHNDCKEIAAIDDVIKNVKTSNALLEIEQTLTEVFQNIVKMRQDREQNLKSVKEERNNIEKEIRNARQKVNNYLDKIQNDLLKELSTVEEKQCQQIQLLMQSIEKEEATMKELQNTFENIKQYASDLQAFLAMKQIDEDLVKKEKFIQSVMDSDGLNHVLLSCNISITEQKFIEAIQKFGDVNVEVKQSQFTLIKQKDKEAQIMISSEPSPSIEQIKLQLEKSFQTDLTSVSGCTFLPDGRMCMCSTDGRVKCYKPDGSCDFEIKCNLACDVTFITEDNIIALTTGSNIQMIDLNDKKVQKNINTGTLNFGIAAHGRMLYFIAPGRGIRKLNIDDESIVDLAKSDISIFSYISISGENIYYTNNKRHTVTCCDLEGTTKWTLKDDRVLQNIHGIDVDSYGNSFVASCRLPRVVVISSDGKHQRNLPSTDTGLSKPWALQYDRTNNKLLVAKENGNAFLFKVIGNK